MSTSGLVRDFTDEEKSEIISIITALNEEDEGLFNSALDWFGDRGEDIGGIFCGEYDISDYLDDIEKYHRIIMDKKNSSEKQINKIFDAVNEKDEDYEKCFNNIKDRLGVLKSSITSIADVLDPSPVAEGKQFKLSMSDFTAKGINDGLVNYYYNKYKDGDDYDWTLIKEAGGRKAEDISEAEYAALCKIIDDLSSGDSVDEERYNKLLNAFYINPKADPNDQSYHMYYRQEVDYELSPVFEHIAARYIVYGSSEINKYLSTTDGIVYNTEEGDNVQRIIFNMSVLSNIVQHGKVGNKDGILDSSVDGGCLDFVEAIGLKKSSSSEANKYDYDLNLRGIGDYKIRTYNNGNELYDKIQGEEIEYLNNGCGNGYLEMGEGIALTLAGFGPELVPYIVAGISVSQAITAPAAAEDKKQECINLGDARSIGRMLESCQVNASITIDGQKVNINYANIDKNSLELLLWMYDEETGEKLTKEQCEDFLLKGDNSVKDTAMKYCNWYYDEGDKTMDDMKNFYAGISKEFDDKKFDDLTLDQKKEVYKRYKEALGD